MSGLFDRSFAEHTDKSPYIFGCKAIKAYPALIEAKFTPQISNRESGMAAETGEAETEKDIVG